MSTRASFLTRIPRFERKCDNDIVQLEAYVTSSERQSHQAEHPWIMAISLSQDEILKTKYDMKYTGIRTSTQITKQVASILAALEVLQEAKPVLLALKASTQAANKLISIVEIVKRESKARDKTVFQYTALSSEMMTIKPRTRKLPDVLQQSEDEDSGDAFEPLTPVQPTERVSPVLVIYLASTSINELKASYGSVVFRATCDTI